MTVMNAGPAEASPVRPWPAERIEHWPIERLIPYANNPRLHSEADLDKIAASILKMGVDEPGPGRRERRADRRPRARPLSRARIEEGGNYRAAGCSFNTPAGAGFGERKRMVESSSLQRGAIELCRPPLVLDCCCSI
jgi:hypothetical protein